MSGYWGDEQSTRAALVGGWLMTGDLGAIDEDGLLTLKGRAKELIISGRSNIYPREVEEVLLRHPAVAEVAVHTGSGLGRKDRGFRRSANRITGDRFRAGHALPFGDRTLQATEGIPFPQLFAEEQIRQGA